MTNHDVRSLRHQVKLLDQRSFDHVGRDAGASSLISGEVLAEIARNDQRIVCGTADIQFVTHLAEFRLEHPERMFQFGISERTMVGAAAGMAASGLIPYVSTFASFLGILAYENIRTDCAYPNLPVRLLATHTGISMGFFGSSHHATEDISALRSVANLMVLSPSDGPSYAALLRMTVDHDGPIYFRLGRGRDRDLHDPVAVEGLTPGQPIELREGKRVAILATGSMVAPAVDAADALALARGTQEIAVYDVHTLKPFDIDNVVQALDSDTVVLTVEEHNVEGGLGSMTQEYLAQRGLGNPVHKHGLQDEYVIVGPPAHLYTYYGMDAGGIETVAGRLLEAPPGLRPLAPMWTQADRDEALTSVRSRTTSKSS
jgi:transketolase